MTNTPTIVLKKGHVLPVWAGHPWVFAQAIARVQGRPEPGDEVEVEDPEGKRLGRGLYSGKGAISVRLFSAPGRPIDGDFFRGAILRALARRQQLSLPDESTTGYRLVHGEGDGLPGLIVDRFGDTLVVQLGSVGLQQRADLVCDALVSVTGCSTVVDRTSPGSVLAAEFQAGNTLRGERPEALEFVELGIRYSIPMTLSQKTGYYFDQRPLRRAVGDICRGKRVLDAHTYVGSTALCAARGGASYVLGTDTSALAIDVARAHAERLGYPVTFDRKDSADAFRAAADEPFDVVICDPPKLARSRGDRDRAMGALRKMLTAACKATRLDGTLIVSSCSSAIGSAELSRAASLAGAELGRSLITTARLFQGPDHPVPTAFPEGLYLSTLVMRVEERHP